MLRLFIAARAYCKDSETGLESSSQDVAALCFVVPVSEAPAAGRRALLREDGESKPGGTFTVLDIAFSDISFGMCLCLMSWVQQVHNAAVVARSLGCQCDTEIPTGRTLTET